MGNNIISLKFITCTLIYDENLVCRKNLKKNKSLNLLQVLHLEPKGPMCGLLFPLWLELI